MKLVLLGYMGVGKSTLGKLLSKTLNLKFIDLDVYIENQAKLEIPELFKQKGEIYFRKLESKALEDVIQNETNFVLSLGGGTPVYGRNMQTILDAEGLISVYLKLQIEPLVERLFQEKASRPLISHYQNRPELEEFVRKHLFERQPFYFMANHVLDITSKTAEEALHDAIQLLPK